MNAPGGGEMFIQPPFMGNGVTIRVKELCRRHARNISGLQVVLIWSVMVVVGLAIAALLAWLLTS
jgi:hypothetical protein